MAYFSYMKNDPGAQRISVENGPLNKMYFLFHSHLTYSVCSRCLFLYWSSPILIFLPSLFNVRPKVACRDKLFEQLRVFSVPLSVHDFIFHSLPLLLRSFTNSLTTSFV